MNTCAALSTAPCHTNATLKSGTTPLSGKSVTIYHYVKGVKYIDVVKTTNTYGKITFIQMFGSTGIRTYYAKFAGDARYKGSTSSVLKIIVINYR